MRSLAAYVVRGRLQATLVVVASALFGLLLPPLGYFGGAAVALVTLRMGQQEGLLLILRAALLVGLIGVLLMHNPVAGVVFALVLWLPVWGLAASLRRTASQARSLLLAALFGVMAVLAFHAWSDDPVQWWYGVLQEFLRQAGSQLVETEQAQLLQELRPVASVMTGVTAQALSASLIACLMLGRWWQAVLYNPGGFGDEFRQIRMGKGLTLGALLLVAAAALLHTQLLYLDLAVVLLLPFAVQALAVVHTLVRQKQAHDGWLVALYVLIVLNFGHMALLLGVVGALDNWFEFRRFFGPKGRAG